MSSDVSTPSPDCLEPLLFRKRSHRYTSHPVDYITSYDSVPPELDHSWTQLLLSWRNSYLYATESGHLCLWNKIALLHINTSCDKNILINILLSLGKQAWGLCSKRLSIFFKCIFFLAKSCGHLQLFTAIIHLSPPAKLTHLNKC